MTNSLSALSLDQLKQAVSLKEQIAALEAELNAILGGDAPALAPAPTAPADIPRRRGRPPGKRAEVAEAEPSVPPATAKTGRGGARNMSPEARARIAAAQKARWAKYHAANGGAKPAKAGKAAASPKQGGMSREERGRLGALARWAKIRKKKG